MDFRAKRVAKFPILMDIPENMVSPGNQKSMGNPPID